MPKETWMCPECGASGSADEKKGEDMFDVVSRIETTHREVSPNCSKSSEPGGYRHFLLLRE